MHTTRLLAFTAAVAVTSCGGGGDSESTVRTQFELRPQGYVSVDLMPGAFDPTGPCPLTRPMSAIFAMRANKGALPQGLAATRITLERAGAAPWSEVASTSQVVETWVSDAYWVYTVIPPVNVSPVGYYRATVFRGSAVGCRPATYRDGDTLRMTVEFTYAGRRDSITFDAAIEAVY
jgi:hypothetical protein